MGKCFLAKPVNLENLDTIDGRSLNLVLCLALPKLTKMVYFFLPDVAVDVFVVVFRDVQFDGALAPVDALGILPPEYADVVGQLLFPRFPFSGLDY